MEEPYYILLYWHNDEWNVDWAGEDLGEAYKRKDTMPSRIPDATAIRMIESEII